MKNNNLIQKKEKERTQKKKKEKEQHKKRRWADGLADELGVISLEPTCLGPQKPKVAFNSTHWILLFKVNGKCETELKIETFH